ncbi:helix-turn-helix domain-containing protein [Microvirga sp. GCM10011540]|uniref:AraC family transcriptional regulator n=1 Tax=Microvirga sp. GCM10011540 TaxID=3317338 RepID=UPI003618ABAE
MEVVCSSGPLDRPFEEMHGWTSVSAVLEGTFTYRSSRGRALMVPGSLLLGNGGSCYECGHEHGIGDRCVSLQYSPELVEETVGELKGLRRETFHHVRIPPLERLLPLLGRIHLDTTAPDALRAEETALELLAVAFALDHDVTRSVFRTGEERCVAQAIGIINARFAERLSIAYLAQAVGMRRRQFAASFKRVAGVTPYNYILNRRLDAAADYLRTGSDTVLNIALDTGFGDLSEFTRRFRARFGSPPAAFRAHHSLARRGHHAAPET